MQPLSTTRAIKTESGDDLRRMLIARAEVIRLGRNPRSTADWHRYYNAKERLVELEAAAGKVAA